MQVFRRQKEVEKFEVYNKKEINSNHEVPFKVNDLNPLMRELK